MKFFPTILSLSVVLVAWQDLQAVDLTKTNKSYALVRATTLPIGGGPLGVIVSYNLDFYGEADIERSSFITASPSFILHDTNGPVTVHDPSSHWLYFRATNSVCGPMELQDATGKKLSPLKPEINSPDAYPSSYRLTIMSQAFRTKMPHSSHPPLPLVPETGTTAQLPHFLLTDYFKPEERGEYRLTIWPKIYKRSATNDDLCERIDLPSVTIPIEWKGES